MMLYNCKLKHFAKGNSNEQKEIREKKHIHSELNVDLRETFQSHQSWFLKMSSYPGIAEISNQVFVCKTVIGCKESAIKSMEMFIIPLNDKLLQFKLNRATL